MRIRGPYTLLPLALLAAAGCNEHPFSSPLKLGGKEVSAEVLNQGHDAYQQYCRPCHGDKGDGKGYSSLGLRPPPRDFTQGMFKFGGVDQRNENKLPPDTALIRIVKGGLHGTAMLPWEIPDQELSAILQYVKTFSPKWQKEPLGALVEMSPDPFGAAKAADAAEQGKKVYHAKAQCSGCHPAFVTHEELFTISKEMAAANKMEVPTTMEFSPEMYHSQIKESEYCLEWKPGAKTLEDRECAKVVKVMPPDFTRDDVRSGTTIPDLYRTIASGIVGANMPTWKGGGLADDEIWSIVYYVKSLIDLKGTAGAKALHAKLAAPANLSWTVAPAAPPAPAK
jgi:mono/diheme cytochrome c family protein